MDIAVIQWILSTLSVFITQLFFLPVYPVSVCISSILSIDKFV